MDLSVVIVNFRSRAPLLSCLEALGAQPGGLPHEVVVVDNSPGDGAVEAVAERFPTVRSLANLENLGFSRAVNQGLRATSGAFVLVINPDCDLAPGALGALMAHMAAEARCGIAGPRIENPDGSIEFSARGYPGPGAVLFNRYSLLTRLFPRNRWSRRYLMSDWDHATPRDVDWLSGACLLVRRAAIAAVGALDEAFFMFNEDVDWCRRMNLAGWRVTYVPEARAVHHIGASRRRVSAKVVWERHRGMRHYFHKHHPTNALLGLGVDAAITARALVMLAVNATRRAS